MICHTCKVPITYVEEEHDRYYVDSEGDSLSYVPTLHDHKPQDHWNGWACQDCTMLIANGETPPEMSEKETDAWLAGINKLMEGTEHVTLGGLIGDGNCRCDGPDHDDGCEEDGFSWSQCDHCGTTLGGYRHAITGWIA